MCLRQNSSLGLASKHMLFPPSLGLPQKQVEICTPSHLPFHPFPLCLSLFFVFP